MSALDPVAIAASLNVAQVNALLVLSKARSASPSWNKKVVSVLTDKKLCSIQLPAIGGPRAVITPLGQAVASVLRENAT